MKITKSQLKRIIAEQVSEMKPQAFYGKKSRELEKAAVHLEKALGVINALIDAELETPMGEDPDLQSLAMDIQSAMDFAISISDAVDALG
jgi:hypothetical protein